jgi:hypothetical protein
MMAVPPWSAAVMVLPVAVIVPPAGMMVPWPSALPSATTLL